MKKFLLLIAIVALSLQTTYAEAAKIRINLNGVPASNRYFLCIMNIGCLSIHAAKNGKVYRIIHPFKMSEIFIADANRFFRVYREGSPKSCRVTVKKSQTITISGTIVKTPLSVRIHQLRCKLK